MLDKVTHDKPPFMNALAGMLRPLIVGAMLYLGIFAALHLFRLFSPSATTSVSDLLIFLASAFSAAVVLSAAVSVRQSTGTFPRAWLLLGLAQALFAAGDGTWFLISAVFGKEPFPSVSDGFYLLYFPVQAIGILYLSGQRVRLEDRAKIMLDMAIVMLSAAVLFWIFLMEPLLPVYRTTPLSAALVTIYLAADFGMLFPLVQMLLTKLSGAQRQYVLLIAAGIVLHMIADLNLWRESINANASEGKLQDIVEIASHFCLAIAAVVWLDLRRRGLVVESRLSIAYGNSAVALGLPGIWATAAFWSVVAFSAGPHAIPWYLLAGVVGVVFPMVLGRQLLVLADNRKLVQAAEHEIAERRKTLQELQDERSRLDDRVLERTQQLSQTISELKREFEAREAARKELLESELRLSVLVENLPVILFLIDTNGVVLLLKGKGLDQLPSPSRLAVGRSVFDLAGEFPEAVASARRALQGETVHSELVIGRATFDIWYAPHRDMINAINGVIGVAADITWKKRAEEQLLMTQFSVDHSSEAVFWVDDDGSYLYVNETACTLLGYTRDELLRMKVFDVTMKLDSATFFRHRGLMKPGNSLIIESEHRTKQGAIFPVEITANYFEHNGRLIAFTYVRDITERKQAQAALFAEKERLSVTLRSLGEGVITADTEGRVILINRTAEQLTGWKHDDAVGRQLEEVFPILDAETRRKKTLPAASTLRRTVTQSRGNTVLVGHDGVERLVAYTESPVNDRDSRTIGVVLAFRDVTEQMRAQQELLKAEKLESIGVLAGGIAHDFNNLLTSILGNMSLAQRFIPEDSKASHRIQSAERAAARAQDLTRQLLTFTKGGSPIRHAMPIGQVVRESAFFPLSGSNVRCTFSLPETLWPVNADEGQISQVIHNLVLNADQAMPDGGHISISAENMMLEPDNEHGLAPGRYIRIAITDTGKGIPRDHLSKIFDPYFTTKTMGSGLGLATCYAILRNHDGLITVASDEGRGSTFALYLPASSDGPESTDNAAGGLYFSGTGRILIMDDEAELLETAGQMLSHLGFQATTVQDGTEALNAYQKAHEQGEPFAAVIMDITVPGGMGGQELIGKLLQYDPQVRAIVSSGYSTDPLMTFYRESGFAGVLFKPYTLDQIAGVLDKVLSGSSASRPAGASGLPGETAAGSGFVVN